MPPPPPRLTYCALAIACLGVPACADHDDSAASPVVMSDRHRAAVRALVKPIMDDRWLSGLVVGLVSPEGREFYAWGAADEAGTMPDEHTLWEIGSISKTFTGLLLAKAVTDRDLALDQPVQTLLPSARVTMPTRNGKQITLQQLSTHSSGLPVVPDNLQLSQDEHPDDPYATYSEDRLFDFLNSYRLPRDPGADWEYSNLGAGLLGHALGLHAEQPWATLMAQTIAEPAVLREPSGSAPLRRACPTGHGGLTEAPQLAVAVLLRGTRTGQLRPCRSELRAAKACTGTPTRSASACGPADGDRWRNAGPDRSEPVQVQPLSNPCARAT